VDLAGAPEGHPLIQQAVVTDHPRFADHHAHAVVDEDPLADACSGVNLDPRDPAPELADQAG